MFWLIEKFSLFHMKLAGTKIWICFDSVVFSKYFFWALQKATWRAPGENSFVLDADLFSHNVRMLWDPEGLELEFNANIKGLFERLWVIRYFLKVSGGVRHVFQQLQISSINFVNVRWEDGVQSKLNCCRRQWINSVGF